MERGKGTEGMAFVLGRGQRQLDCTFEKITKIVGSGCPRCIWAPGSPEF